MKKQIAGLLTGLLVCSAFLTGCGKNEATEAVKESVEDENEGPGDTKDADSKKDTNRKSDKQDSDKSDENSEESETTEAPEENLDKVGVLLPEEGEDINSSLERTELKSRLEEAGYEAAMYFAGDDSDTQAEQIRVPSSIYSCSTSIIPLNRNNEASSSGEPIRNSMVRAPLSSRTLSSSSFSTIFLAISFPIARILKVTKYFTFGVSMIRLS